MLQAVLLFYPLLSKKSTEPIEFIEHVLSELRQSYGTATKYTKQHTLEITNRCGELFKSIQNLQTTEVNGKAVNLKDTLDRLSTLQEEAEHTFDKVLKMVNSLPVSNKTIVQPLILELEENKKELSIELMAIIDNDLKPFIEFNEKFNQVKKHISVVLEGLQYQDRVEQIQSDCDALLTELIQDLSLFFSEQQGQIEAVTSSEKYESLIMAIKQKEDNKNKNKVHMF